MQNQPVTPNGNCLVRSDKVRRRTMGFPALPNERPKKVWFDPPRPVTCNVDGEAVYTDCLVLCIWDFGAKLRVRDASILTEFDLYFASGPMPVKRHCKRRRVRGNVMDVEFKREPPDYFSERGHA